MRTITRTGMLAFAAGSIMLSACNSSESRDAEVSRSSRTMRDSFDRVFNTTMKDINANLATINEKEGVIMLGPGSPMEKNITAKEQILRNIRLINSLIDDNKQKIVRLDQQVKDYADQAKISGKQLNRYKTENQRLQKSMDEAERKLSEYEVEVANLKTEITVKTNELSDVNSKLGVSTNKCQSLQQYSDMYEKIAYTAYYAKGDHKKLENDGVLKKENMIGKITGKEKLSEDLSKKNFVAIDIRRITSIPVNAKKAKLVTTHPASSYELKKSGDMIASIEIKDPEEFWKTSKYLVVETH